ncbi:hypothetical protein LCGC14_2791350 [marine sediment metagenome]|uniref:Endonuclease GajA/Old nuclease/RecF-like AAA domain-containing protein n=1 Tax=marine sediment metagenome TaxID=412755 RepID=A0A0F8ZCI6_9ZZZZ
MIGHLINWCDYVFNFWHKQYQYIRENEGSSFVPQEDLKKYYLIKSGKAMRHTAIIFKYNNFKDNRKDFRWYFSFFLVFLFESEGLHKNAILLLDEPGIHLHLKVQFNLINFFQNLKDSVQIIYTTHSQFLIDKNPIILTSN